MIWHEENPALVRAYKEEAAKFLFGAEFPPIGGDGELNILGRVWLRNSPIRVNTKVRIIFPKSFIPRGQLPIVYDEERKYKAPDPEGHINFDHSFCLGVQGNTYIDYPEFSMRRLIEYLHVYLLQQELYQLDKIRAFLKGTRAKWPGKSWAHGEAGEIQAAREREPYEYCVCGSGKLYRECCRSLYGIIRTRRFR